MWVTMKVERSKPSMPFGENQCSADESRVYRTSVVPCTPLSHWSTVSILSDRPERSAESEKRACAAGLPAASLG